MAPENVLAVLHDLIEALDQEPEKEEPEQPDRDPFVLPMRGQPAAHEPVFGPHGGEGCGENQGHHNAGRPARKSTARERHG